MQRQLVGIRDQDGIAADLYGELSSADHGRANALAGIPYRRQIATVREHVAQLLGEVGAEIAEAPSLALVEIFCDPA